MLVLAGFAGWLAYNQIQKQLNASKPVTVGDYTKIRESAARAAILNAGLKPEIKRQPSTAQPPTFVFDQAPSAGNKIDKGNAVTIFVSTGPAKAVVPDVRGKSATDAAAAIASAGLKPDVHEVNSAKDVNTVVAQAPKPGVKVVKGSKVRINVSKGPPTIAVPPVVGLPFAQASSELQAKGFAVKRNDQDSNEAAGIVLSQDPGGNTPAPEGSTITLAVSKGPKTTQVPDVTSIDEQTATTTLQQSGFKVKVVRQQVADPSQNNVVLDQSPPPNSQAKPGTTVTIYVGHFGGQTTSTTTTGP